MEIKETTLEQLDEARQKYAEAVAKNKSFKNKAKKVFKFFGSKDAEQHLEDEQMSLDKVKEKYSRTLKGYKDSNDLNIGLDLENRDADLEKLEEITQILAKEGVQLDTDIINARIDRLGKAGGGR